MFSVLEMEPQINGQQLKYICIKWKTAKFLLKREYTVWIFYKPSNVVYAAIKRTIFLSEFWFSWNKPKDLTVSKFASLELKTKMWENLKEFYGDVIMTTFDVFFDFWILPILGIVQTWLQTNTIQFINLACISYT